MVSRPSDLAPLIDTVLQERAEAVSFSDQEIAAQAARLRAGFAQIRDGIAARRRVIDAIESLPASRRAGWLEGVQSALKIVLSEARRTSRVLVDAASDLLPAASDKWVFAPATMATTRSGESVATRAESVDPASTVSRTVIVDDAAAEPRVLAIVSNYPAEATPPVLLVVAEDSDKGGSTAFEIDPEIGADRDTGRRRLRYEATLPPGAYYLFFGNPRDLRR